jgi:hypothetical protein
MFFVPYIVAAAFAAFGSWYITDTFADNKYNALVVKHQGEIIKAKEDAKTAEDALEVAKKNVTVRYITRTVAVQTIAKVANDEIARVATETPSLTDPNCAWSDSVRDAVNRARHAGAPDSGPSPAPAVPKAPRRGGSDPR